MSEIDPQNDPSYRGAYNEAYQRRVREIPFWKSLILLPLAIFLRLWLMTLRIHVSSEGVQRLFRDKNPLIIIFLSFFIIIPLYRLHVL